MDLDAPAAKIEGSVKCQLGLDLKSQVISLAEQKSMAYLCWKGARKSGFWILQVIITDIIG